MAVMLVANERELLASYWKKMVQEHQQCLVAMVFSSLMEGNWLGLFSKNTFSQAAQAGGFACKEKLPPAGRKGMHPATYCRTKAGELLGTISKELTLSAVLIIALL